MKYDRRNERYLSLNSSIIFINISMRTIQRIHKPTHSLIRELITYTALPTRTIDYLDPFLFLNHHGYQEYPTNNQGLPFGPHPHRGMETVTFILEGDIMHQDSSGHASVIEAGGVQWMTAGKGLIHAETSSEKFKKEGGSLEILQLWLNLPARSKMTEPFYQGLQKEDIPTNTLDEGKVTINVTSGEIAGTKGVFTSEIGVSLGTLYFKESGKLSLDIPKEHTIFFYVIDGKLAINGQTIEARSLVEFKYDDTQVNIEALADSKLLFGHALPLNEPVVSQGPFVMNTEEEIYQAYQDYQAGKFGKWKF